VLNACPQCQRTFPAEEAAFCPADATKLVAIDSLPTPKDPTDPFVGFTLAGKYEIRRVVADGGMGRVYEARQLEGQRRVAVKILHADIAEDTVHLERFKREAETSQQLDHGNIIDVFDFAEQKPAPGRKDGAWFLVMEYLDGEELRAVINSEKTLPMARVIRMISQAAIGLDGAHQRGFVHRDLKPDNLFLVRTRDGDNVKVLDFGSVKFTKGQDKGQKLTVMGTTIGSPFYMSPEQAKGLPDLDQRADVWALGAIVYECAVGKVPFTAPNGPQILFKILGEEPMPPSFANDAAPPELDDFIVKALNKKREQRYQSCGELADALGHAFGLTGNHLDWAKTPEAEIAKQLQARAGAGASAPTAAAPTAAMPFPMANAAPAQAMPFPMANPAPAQPMPFPMANASSMQPARRMGGPADDVPLDYSPVKKTPTGLYVGIVAALVVLGLIAFLAMK
jgi:serine/threonine-protein kinase